MLEGDVELLTIPPKPFFSPQEEQIEDQEPEIQAEDQESATLESTDLSDEITTGC